MDADLAVPAPAEPRAAAPRLESAAYAALVERKRAEFAHLAPQYELQFQVATLGRMREVWRQVARLAAGGVRGPVLELCCGTGGVTAELARLFDDVIGVDLSPAMLARAEQRVKRERLTNVRLREAEVSTLRYPAASFSAVVISLALHELPLEIRNQVLERASVWLKPGGRFVFCDYVKPQNWLVAALFRWIGRLVIEEEHFDEYLAYSIEANLRRHGFRPIERRRQFVSCLEVSAWTIGGP